MSAFDQKEISYQIGTFVLNKLNNQTYVVTNNVGGVPIATRTVSIYNPDEWEIISEPKITNDEERVG